MKNLIPLFIMMMSFNFLMTQERVEISKIKKKTKRVLLYSTDFKNHYTKASRYYLNGKKYDGIIFENWENGNLKNEFEVKNGKRDGFSRSFHANGIISFDSSIISEIMEPGDYVLGYHENGEISQVVSVLPKDKEGHTFCKTTRYNENGQVWFIKQFKDGMPNGIQYRYDERTGVLRQQTSYKNGERHGLEISYPLYGKEETVHWAHGKRLNSW